MSLERLSIYAPQPSATRASPTHLSVDPKGERLVYASGKSIFLRSIDDPSQSTQYTGHTATTTVARFSPSGFYVASGDASGHIRVWDCVGEDMNTKGEFPIISGAIKDLAWDGESKRIIAVGDGKERFGGAVTFDTGNSVGEITGQSAVINAVSIRQQRPFRAVTASDDHTAVFYHGAPFKFNALLKGHHSGFVHGAAFSPNGDHFVTVGADRKIFLFDGKEGTFIAEITSEDAHRGSILSVSWSPDSTKFVTASADQTVKIWDLETKSCVHTWRFGPDNTTSAAHQQVGVVWTPRADNLIISLSLSGDLSYLSPDSPTPLRTVVGHQKGITALAITDDNTLLTGSYDGRVCRWLPGKGVPDLLDGPGHTNSIPGFALGPAGAFSIGWDDHLRQLDPAASLFVAAAKTTAQPVAIAPAADKTLVLTRKGLDVYTSPTTAPVSHALPYDPTALAASDKFVAVGAQDAKTYIYASSDFSKPLHTLTSNRSTITALAFSPAGEYLAAGDSQGKIMCYETAGWTVKTSRWAFHTARVEGIAWNKAGTHVVSGGLDTQVVVYSVERPVKNRKVRNAHEEGVKGVAWEEGGEQGVVVTVGADGAVKRWSVGELP